MYRTLAPCPSASRSLRRLFLVVDSESGQEPDPAILRELFGLTPAEARITGRLVLGRSVEEIAQETGVWIETVRSQVRSVCPRPRQRGRES